MPRRARVHYISLRSSLVNLPISIYGPLLERNVRPQHLAVHLKLVSIPQNPDRNAEAYVGWTGMASASSLTHFSSAHATEKVLETVEIDPQYAQEVSIAPKLHRSDRRVDTKDHQALPGVTPSVVSTEESHRHNSHVLRVVPRAILPRVAVPDYSGPELVGFVSQETYEKCYGPGKLEEGSFVSCSKFHLKRLMPPPEPSSPHQAIPPPPLPPVSRVIKPSVSGKEDTPDRNVQQEDTIFVGSLAGVPDSHIVFPASPRGIEDWDLLVLRTFTDGQAWHWENIHYTLFVDLSPYVEQPISTIKSLMQYWFDKVIWHKPSILILDNLDKLVGAELEVRLRASEYLLTFAEGFDSM
ncbi:hypothetical protein C0991_001085 [Blastosporella zonata]|nr:hypothetical protein C0991_001085 [Blastosporella zonata]